MAITNVSHASINTASFQKQQAAPVKPRDPDHDNDADKAGVADNDSKGTSSFLNIKA